MFFLCVCVCVFLFLVFGLQYVSEGRSETEFVGAIEGASLGTNLKAVLVLNYTLTLLTSTYMAIGAFP